MFFKQKAALDLKDQAPGMSWKPPSGLAGMKSRRRSCGAVEQGVVHGGLSRLEMRVIINKQFAGPGNRQDIRLRGFFF
ncbi:hypothetical protein [Pseudomonas sp. MWU349]|uniref:hypothetical protein n=1 Tax=Pseudomonas sp. MWU349 TaxID=2802572 RepID=UPI001B31AB8E|nr:hypothetical protein [Pseudomonas sp. MWU349]